MCILSSILFVYFFHICTVIQHETVPALCLYAGVSLNNDGSVLLSLLIQSGCSCAPLVVCWRQRIVDGHSGFHPQLCFLYRLYAAQWCHLYFDKVIFGFVKEFGTRKVDLHSLRLLRISEHFCAHSLALKFQTWFTPLNGCPKYCHYYRKIVRARE